jgi:hypothetical protein
LDELDENGIDINMHVIRTLTSLGVKCGEKGYWLFMGIGLRWKGGCNEENDRS